jgi:predicted nucleic acid-binding protein
MLFDTDILIWVFRGNKKAAGIIEKEEERLISIVTYMELLQGAKSKKEQINEKRFLTDFGFQIIPLIENIGLRASIYMEEYSLKTDMCMGDALIAATAVETQLTLCTSNQKHYKAITDLDLKTFKP